MQRLDLSKLTPEQRQAGYAAFCAVMKAKRELELVRGTAAESAAISAYNAAAKTYHDIIKPAI